MDNPKDDDTKAVATSDHFSYSIDTFDDLAKSESSPFLSRLLGEVDELQLNKSQSKDTEQVVRLSHTTDETKNRNYGPWLEKAHLLPDAVLKGIAGHGGNDLVAQILQTRSNHLSQFGRPRDSRFDIGFDLLPKDKSKLPKDPKKMEELASKVEKAKEILWQCGILEEVIGEPEGMSFSQCLKMITRDGLLYGRFALEVIYDKEDETKFQAFRPVDAGTIRKTTTISEFDKSARKTMLQEVQRLLKEKRIPDTFDIEGLIKNHYTHVQVLDGYYPSRWFTPEELLVHNLYPVTNVEYRGYPLTPIDQTIHAVTTHINITMHNKLYFQYGRAAKGMLVAKTKDKLDERRLQNLRMQFQQTINSVKHAHRIPTFAIGLDDSLEWKAIQGGNTEMEFQYLADTVSRIVMGAFQISPDELPGYQHLSKGSNSQSLSESNNEFKLEASRDVGIRPLLLSMQDFFNKNIIPVIDEEVAQFFALSFLGLDKDSPEKEAAKLQQDIQTHASMNDVLDVVEKERLPTEVGGDLIMNPSFWAQIDKLVPVGQQMEFFLKRAGAGQDPRFDYIRDPFYFQHLALIQQETQMKMQLAMTEIQKREQAALPQPAAGQEQQQSQSASMGKNEEFVSAGVELARIKKKYGV